MKEWRFEEDSDKVSLERIDFELDGVPVVMQIIYFHELKKNAPLVYERYREFRDGTKGYIEL